MRLINSTGRLLDLYALEGKFRIGREGSHDFDVSLLPGWSSDLLSLGLGRQLTPGGFAQDGNDLSPDFTSHLFLHTFHEGQMMKYRHVKDSSPNNRLWAKPART